MKTRKKYTSSSSRTRLTKGNDKVLRLIKDFNKGDLEAFQTILKTHTGLIKAVVEKHSNQGFSERDLLMHGMIGLMKATHRYKETKLVNFRSYAIWWIRQAILKAIKEQNNINNIPGTLVENLKETINLFNTTGCVNDIELAYNDLEKIIEDTVLKIQKNAKNH